MASPSTVSTADLLRLVDTEPQRVADAARAGLAERSNDAPEAAQLLWVWGLAERELGRLTTSRALLERARRIALDAGERAVAARVAVSLAYEIGHAGDLVGALSLLDDVERDVDRAD